MQWLAAKKYISCCSVHGGSCSFSVAVCFSVCRLAVANHQTFNCARQVFNIDSIANISLASSHYNNDKGVYKKGILIKVCGIMHFVLMRNQVIILPPSVSGWYCCWSLIESELMLIISRLQGQLRCCLTSQDAVKMLSKDQVIF